MNSTATLTGPHLRTYETIFQHPVSHNLAWRAVRTLLARLGHVTEEPNGNLKVTRNGHLLVLPPPRTKDVADIDELMTLRHFLERSETIPAQGQPPETQWLVVIDRHEARIYRSFAPDAVPQLIRSHSAEKSFRPAPSAKEVASGLEKSEQSGFFEPVAGVLNGAGKILIFGSGTGNSSEMDQFAAWLQNHRPELAKRIVGTVVIDEHHLTEAQILAQAREFLARVVPPPGADGRTGG